MHREAVEAVGVDTDGELLVILMATGSRVQCIVVFHDQSL